MKFRSIALAVAMVSSSVPALAVNADLGTLGSGSFGNFFGSAAMAFVDTFTFELASPSTVTGAAAAVGIAQWALVVEDTMGNDVASDASPGSFAFNLGAGMYTLNVVGMSAGAGSVYGGNISASPIPEPQTYALLLAGLGIVAFIGARRRDRS